MVLEPKSASTKTAIFTVSILEGPAFIEMSTRRAAHARRQASVDYPRYPPSNSQTQQPPVQMLPIPPVSDYESDTQGYGSDFPTKPPPPGRSIEELNIAVLTRHNPEIIQIMSIVAYAVIYEFSPVPEPTWTKTGVEGSMFICQLTAGLYGEDRYNVVVLNRRGLNNFDVELREAEDSGVEISDPYVILSCKENHEQKIYGVFIFSEGSGTSTEQQRTDNANLMKILAVSAGTGRKVAEAAAAEAVAKHHDGHVQEAVSTLDDAVSQDRQASLLHLFGQQKPLAAPVVDSYPPAHNTYQTHQPSQFQQHPSVYPGQNTGQAPQQDVLGDLFRRAGLK